MAEGGRGAYGRRGYITSCRRSDSVCSGRSCGCHLSWFPRSGVGVLEGHTAAALAMVIAAAVVCLGPGAFSLDARLFGWREIILPDQPSDPDSKLHT